MRVSRRRKKENIRLYQPGPKLSIDLPSPQATLVLGRQLVRRRLPHVWLLRGDLGAGKTTLVMGALRALGVHGRITSPTFMLLKKYPLGRGRWSQAIHIDAYRLRGRHELPVLDLVEIINDEKSLVLIEWPERLRMTIRQPVTNIALRHHGSGRRAVVRIRPARPKDGGWS